MFDCAFVSGKPTFDISVRSVIIPVYILTYSAHGRRLMGGGGFEVRDGPCISRPNIWRSSVISRLACESTKRLKKAV